MDIWKAGQTKLGTSSPTDVFSICLCTQSGARFLTLRTTWRSPLFHLRHCLFCLRACAQVFVCVWALGEWPLLLAAVYPGCGTCVVCVMGSEEQGSVSVELNRPSHELRHHKWPLVHTRAHTDTRAHMFQHAPFSNRYRWNFWRNLFEYQKKQGAKKTNWGCTVVKRW